MEINLRGNSNLELPTKNDVQMNELLQDNCFRILF